MINEHKRFLDEIDRALYWYTFNAGQISRDDMDRILIDLTRKVRKEKETHYPIVAQTALPKNEVDDNF